MTHSADVSLHNPPSDAIPFTVQAQANGIKLADWIKANKQSIDALLVRHGALLFRDFMPFGEEGFPDIVNHLCDETLSYVYRSTPRSQVGDKIYTATEYPAHKSIPFHNEEAYTLDWPMRLVFYCAVAADEGGETPIADTTKVTARISPDIKEKFAKAKVMYVRNYGTGVDLDWETVFQTKDKAEVERYCCDHHIEFDWKANGCLRTRQICQALAAHPITGQMIWFNQAHLFHVSSLDEKTRRSLLAIYEESELPRNAYYGDGTPIEEEALQHIRAAFEAERVAYPWKQGDVMLLDNMLVSHARNPYKGKRRVLVGMGDAYSMMSRRTVAASA